MGKVKQVEIKKRTFYFYNDIINIEEFISNSLKIDKKSYKNMGIYILGISQLKTLVIVKIFTV